MSIQLPIAKPPFKALGKKLESITRKALYEHQLLENVDHLAVALSGGKDSLSLLYLLHAISGNGFSPFKLTAIHVDGEFSCGAGMNAGFLKGICKEMNIPFIQKTTDRKREHLACYSCSRERRKLLFNAAKECGITHIAFGHHKDDSVQTLLLNLLHKAEFAYNLPKITMKQYGVTIIRPLIYAEEKDLITFAKQHGFMRISCQCPVGQTSKRKTAAELLSVLEEHFPHAKNNLFLAAKQYGSKKALHP